MIDEGMQSEVEQDCVRGIRGDERAKDVEKI